MVREDGSRCALGSLVQHQDRFEPVHYDCAIYLARALGFIGPLHNSAAYVARYNDNHTHEEVLAMFDRAIELAENDEIAAEMDKISVDELIEVLSPA